MITYSLRSNLSDYPGDTGDRAGRPCPCPTIKTGTFHGLGSNLIVLTSQNKCELTV